MRRGALSSQVAWFARVRQRLVRCFSSIEFGVRVLSLAQFGVRVLFLATLVDVVAGCMLLVRSGEDDLHKPEPYREEFGGDTVIARRSKI